MTVGELAKLFNHEFGIGCDLTVVPMAGYDRSMWFDQTGAPWVIPSPNMPTPDTATVYPGAVYVEGRRSARVVGQRVRLRSTGLPM
jgi:uncharacterized protein YbbC (DUF1343 family)